MRIESAHERTAAKIEQQLCELAIAADLDRVQTRRRQRRRECLAIERFVPPASEADRARIRLTGSHRRTLAAFVDRREHQSLEFTLHALQMPLGGVHQCIPTSFAHGTREPRPCVRILGQGMRLFVAQHLQAILERAQESIGLAERFDHLWIQQPTATE